MNKITRSLILSAVFIALAFTSNATIYYSKPYADGGDIAANGLTPATAWASLHDLAYGQANNIGNITLAAGDTLYLMSSTYGNGPNAKPLDKVAIWGLAFTDYVTVMPDPNATTPPIITGLELHDSPYWSFQNLIIDGTNLNTDLYAPAPYSFVMFGSYGTSDHTKLENCTIISTNTDVTAWTTNQQWYDNVYCGVQVRAEYSTITNCTIKNVYTALEVRGDNSIVKHNTIENFAGDAMRGFGSNSTYEFNLVKNCYVEDYAINHDDAFQAYRLGPPNADPRGYVMENVIIRNNKFFLSTDPNAKSNMIGKSMQGIIVTDGSATNWIVENNLIVNAVSHGITLYGSVDCRIQNNTVVQSHLFTDVNKVPQIWTPNQSKPDAVTSGTTTVRNNICGYYHIEGTWVNQNNINIGTSSSSYSQYFVNYTADDFHLSSTSAAIDAGVNTSLTSTDLDGNPRINNTTVDCGAYEYIHPVAAAAPVLATIGNISTTEGTSKTVTITATDANNDNLTFTSSSLPTGVTLNDNGNNTATITILATAPVSTTTGIIITVSDGSKSDTETITITVNEKTNNVPTLSSIGNKAVTEGSTIAFNLTANDNDGDILTFSFTNLPSFASVVNNSNGSATVTVSPKVGDANTYSNIVIKVSDGTDNDTETISIAVNEKPNNVPILSAIGNKAVTEGSTITFNLTANDNDGDILTFSFTSLPSFASVVNNSSGSATITVSPNVGDAGTYSNIVIKVSDGTDNDTETISIAVSELANNAPVLDAINTITSTAGVEKTINISASDVDNNDLTFSLSGNPDFVTISNLGNGKATINISNTSVAGKYRNITVTVSDGITTTTETISVIVEVVSSVVDAQQTIDFNIYPQPITDNYFTIELNKANITDDYLVQILDMAGKIVLSKVLESNNEQINTNSLKSGLYIIKISTKSKVVNKRLIIN